MDFNIWEGIYSNFEECPKSGEGFQGKTWTSRSRARINKLLNGAKEKKTIPSVVVYCASLLPFLVALVSERSKKGGVGILDFGGGLGFTYIPVIYGCLKQSIDYHIVESKNICQVGRCIFKDDRRIHFHPSLPKKRQRIDIVHLGSSLQYIDDWKALIKNLAGYNPQYFLFTDLIAGNIPTYVTIQNYYDSKIPSRFFNVKEVVNQMSSVGFWLLFNSIYRTTFLGKEQELPQQNFPKKLRLRHTCSLLFSREEI